MICLINHWPGLNVEKLLAALADPFEGARIGTLAQKNNLIAGHQKTQYLILAHSFTSPQNVKELRHELAQYDDEIYLHRFVGIDSAEKTQISWQQAQLAHSQRGDMGYPLPSAHAADFAQKLYNDLHQPISLVPYETQWPEMFETEKKLIRKTTSENLEIVHIGSTALENMPAKPIIDLLIISESWPDRISLIAPLLEAQYHFIDYPQNTTRMFFRKGEPRQFHLHIVAQGSSEHRDHVDFVQALKQNPTRFAEYKALKESAAGKFKARRAHYGAQKSAFIHDVLAEFRAL